MSERVEVETTGHIAEIIFQNPPNNFADVRLLTAIADALESLDHDPRIWTILLRSTGKAFCAGADLTSAKDGIGFIPREGEPDPLRLFYDQALRLFGSKKPIVAAVQGAAIGAGLGLALAADFRVASVEARFSANFVRLGLHPGFGLTHTLPRLVGHQKARMMMLTARRLKGEDALAIGLIDRLTAADQLLSEARQFASELAENAPLSLISVKQALARDQPERVAEALDRELAQQSRLKKTSDYAEGVASVFERRPARFNGC